MMDARRVGTSLRHVGKVYNEILDSSHQIVLPAAQAQVETTKKEYDYAQRNRTRGFTPEPWGYTIDHAQPLKFKPIQIPNGIKVQVDVYCDIRWEDSNAPVKQDIKVRIWSTHEETIFDQNRDSAHVQERLSDPERNQSGRVVSRFHLDRADSEQKCGPKFHLQFGGVPEEYELCWHPKKVNLPRLEHRPMELFLTCQLIAANFFWDKYIEIRKKGEWRMEIIQYQDLMLKDYYTECLTAITNKESLLDTMWIR